MCFCCGPWRLRLGIRQMSQEKRETGFVLGMETEKKTSEDEGKGKICKRCKQSYSPSSNTTSSCRFHPSFFVCRRHDDQKRYYELGPEDPPYAAKFYDCCGAEDPEASGCTTTFHVSYDDD